MSDTCDVAAVVIHAPWRWLSLAVTTALLVVTLYSIWRRKVAALRSARLVDDAAAVLEQGGMPGEAAEFCEQARQWRRHAWPLRHRAEEGR